MEERITKVISAILHIPQDTITSTTGLKTCKQWTSKRHISIIVALEQEFDIEGVLSIEEITKMVTVEKIKEYLSQHGC